VLVGPWSAARLAAGWLDAGACLGVLALALAPRLPGLLAAPSFTDETEEVRLAVQVAQGTALPLVGVKPYLGPWNVYLTALALRLVGPEMVVARGVTLVCGLLTVLAVYWLARALGLGRRVATLGAALLATSGAHTLLASRVAWSNCTTPLYTTLAAVLVALAVRRGRPAWLAPAGVAGGLAVQTHPIALPVLLALAAWGGRAGWRQGWLRIPTRRAASDGDVWRGGRWTLVALGAFVAVNAPLLAFNALSGLGSVDGALAQSADYQGEQALSAGLYLENLGKLLVGLAQVAGSSLVAPEEALADPAVYLGGLLGLAGLGWALRRGAWFVPLGGLLLALALPAVNPKYNLVMNGRYLLPLLPLLVVAEAGAVAAGGRWALAAARAAGQPAVERGRWLRGVAGGGLVALAAWSLVTPLARLRAYEAETPGYNTALLAFAARVEALRQPDEVVLVDERLTKNDLGDPDRGEILTALLDLHGVPNRLAAVEDEDLRQALARAPGASVLLVAKNKTPPDAPFTDAALGITVGEPYRPGRLRVYRVPTRLARG